MTEERYGFCGDAEWGYCAPGADDGCTFGYGSPLPASLADAILPQQTHSDHIAIADGTRTEFPDTDALITQMRDVRIGVRTADCVPVVIYAPDIAAVAAIHAGWKGTHARIVAQTIARLRQLGADPSRMQGAIGPCICGQCYEVSPELADTFRPDYPDAILPHPGADSVVAASTAAISDPLPTVISNPLVDPLTGRPFDPAKPHLDLVRCNFLQLTAAGLPADSICLSGVCTRHSTLRLPSWRRTPAEPRRLITWIRLC